MEELLFAHARDLFSEQVDAAFVWAEQAVGEFEQDTFSYAGGSEEDACFSGCDGEANVLQNRRPGKCDGDIAK
jgi:hypothetical protein